MGNERDPVFEELAALSQRLDDLPPEAFSERLTIRERQRELRARARAAADLADLAGLRERETQILRELESIRQRQLPASSIQGGGDGGSINPYEAMELNRRIVKGGGAPELVEELAQVRDRIERASRLSTEGP